MTAVHTIHRVIEALQVAGTTGLLARELAVQCGASMDCVDRALQRLARGEQAEWWPDPIGHAIRRRRWYSAGQRPTKKPEPSMAPATQPIRPQAKAAPAVKVTVVNGVRIVRAPAWTHDPRYEVAPGAQVFGAGFAALPMGYDINTGRPWA